MPLHVWTVIEFKRLAIDDFSGERRACATSKEMQGTPDLP